MSEERRQQENPEPSAPHFGHEPPAGEVLAWEQIESGRYMPRRIKGSCKGRALG